jgi:hypothetical protein
MSEKVPLAEFEVGDFVHTPQNAMAVVVQRKLRWHYTVQIVPSGGVFCHEESTLSIAMPYLTDEQIGRLRRAAETSQIVLQAALSAQAKQKEKK